MNLVRKISTLQLFKDNEPITQDLQRFYRYNTALTYCPINFHQAWSKFQSKDFHFKRFRWPWHFVENNTRLFFYLCCRSLPVISLVQPLFTLLKYLLCGNVVDHLSLLDSLMWISALTGTFILDFYLLSPKFTLSLFRLMELSNKIWLKVENSIGKEETKKLRQRKNLHVRSIMVFTGVIDCITFRLFEWTSESLLYLFNLLPGTGRIANGALWCLLQVNNVMMDVTWGSLMVFPGMMSITFEHVILGLNKALLIAQQNADKPSINYSAEAILQDYKVMEFAVSELRNNHFSTMLLAYLMMMGMEQTFQCYVAFKMLRSGTFQFALLIDLMLSTPRVLTGLVGLSKLENASRSFLTSVKKWTLVATKKGRFSLSGRKIRCMARNLRSIKMKIGPCACDSDLPLTGMSVYLNYIVAAALWP
ncbi:unnamed protein product [Orchesella dallaii]|uniref:Odorant receptor n=1 Tax=Orchesella dallaii TaxID=48710 RepID=A0ABP1RT79_9HEXA